MNNASADHLRNLLNNAQIARSEQRLNIERLTNILKELLDEMEEQRASGDCGFWEWREDSNYAKARKLLKEFGK